MATHTLDSGLPGVDLRRGDHICGLYFGKEERDTLLVPFLRTGLRAGEHCICIVDAEDAPQVRTVLSEHAHGRDLVSSRLEVLTAAESYLRAGRFSSAAMIEFLGDAVTAVMAGGRADVVRAVGDLTWLLGDLGSREELFAYESEVNRFAPRYPQTLLCLYDLDRFGGGIIVDLLKTHPKLLIGSVLIDNPHCLTPDEYLASRQ